MAFKILLVDDSRDLLDAYVAVLESSTPYEVRTASSGRAAQDIVLTWRPDVVVTDVMMPDMNGLELISEMRSKLPPPLPIVVVWSGFPEFEAEARSRGAQVFQPKPIYPDDLVVLIESLLGQREPPEQLRADTEARRRAASRLAQAQVSETLARRPHFRDVAELNTRLISRYFGGADLALLVMDGGQMRVFAASHSRWGAGTRLEGVLSYAVDVVESGSTLIVPDVAAMPAIASRAPAPDAHLLVAVPLRSDGVMMGALALADRRPVPFDVHDLAILEYIGDRHAAVFAGKEASSVPREPGVLTGEMWRYCLRCEIERLRSGRALVIALAPLPARSSPTIPVSSPEEMLLVTRAVERLLEQLTPRTALGRLSSATLAAYAIVEDAEAGERALRALVTSFADAPDRACLAVLTIRELHPTDGGAAFLEVARWLLEAAMAQGPGTTLHARLTPEIADARRAAA
jgi:CheY-like chemotaxis protein